MAEQGGDGLQPHAAVDGLGGQGVAELVGVDAKAAAAPDPADDPADLVAVEGAAVIGGEAVPGADVVEIGSGPGVQERHELGMQGHVAVVAQLAQWYPQPVGLADAHDGVGFGQPVRRRACRCGRAVP